MKTLFEKVEGLDLLIRDLDKLKGYIYMGQIVEAWRSVNKIIAYINDNKKMLLLSEQNKDDKNEK